jgi:hypothetical protein
MLGEPDQRRLHLKINAYLEGLHRCFEQSLPQTIGTE